MENSPLSLYNLHRFGVGKDCSENRRKQHFEEWSATEIEDRQKYDLGSSVRTTELNRRLSYRGVTMLELGKEKIQKDPQLFIKYQISRS